MQKAIENLSCSQHLLLLIPSSNKLHTDREFQLSHVCLVVHPKLLIPLVQISSGGIFPRLRYIPYFYLTSRYHKGRIVNEVPNFRVAYPPAPSVRHRCMWHGRHQDNIDWLPGLGAANRVPLVQVGLLQFPFLLVKLPVLIYGDWLPAVDEPLYVRDEGFAPRGDSSPDILAAVRRVEAILYKTNQKKSDACKSGAPIGSDPYHNLDTLAMEPRIPIDDVMAGCPKCLDGGP